MVESKEIDNEIRLYLERKIRLSGIPDEYLKYCPFPKDGKEGYNYFDSNGKVNASKKTAFDVTMEYIKNFDRNFNEGKSVFYYGQPNKNLGASLLGTFILRAAIELKKTAKFVPFSTFCTVVGYDGDTEEKEDYYLVDFLMLDSISSKNQDGKKISDEFADILIYRKKEKKPTIFASYVGVEELYGKYSESLISYFENFVIKVKITHEEQYNDALYDMDKLLKYLKEKRNEKRQMSYIEIISSVDKFINSYQFH
jgi:hypothetical protein